VELSKRNVYNQIPKAQFSVPQKQHQGITEKRPNIVFLSPFFVLFWTSKKGQAIIQAISLCHAEERSIYPLFKQILPSSEPQPQTPSNNFKKSLINY